MNAAVFYGPNNIKIKDIDIRKRKSNEILLKVLSCSVCSYQRCRLLGSSAPGRSPSPACKPYGDRYRPRDRDRQQFHFCG